MHLEAKLVLRSSENDELPAQVTHSENYVGVASIRICISSFFIYVPMFIFYDRLECKDGFVVWIQYQNVALQFIEKTLSS